MKYTRLFLFENARLNSLRLLSGLLMMILLSFCSSVKDGKATIKQGVFGKVLWKEGNFMPSPDRAPRPQSPPALRTVYIYKLTKLTETEGESPLFSKINSSFVAKVKTNSEGYFQYKLAPGTYSIFTLEDDGKLFASLSDGDGNVAPFDVKEGEVTKYDININYKAAY